YSYDACAREKRLEQLKVLKDAGLLDAVEYQQRRQEILK
ncbi:MAG: SHOCT domain-containing protein, partial [Oscillospiraceae bacterium]|nr:SHOCT domain-containing protein [Oscillospiraceae bacterium]